MSVKVEFNGDDFGKAFLKELGNKMVKAGGIFRRNLQTVLKSAGKSPPPSKQGTYIPHVATGSLANKWQFSSSATKKANKMFVYIGTSVMYAKWLVIKSGKGQRNYLHKSLGWKKKTIEMMKKALDGKALVTGAMRSMKQ